MQLFMQDKRNPSVFIEFIRDDETGKIYLWNMQRGRMFTWEEINQILAFFREYVDNVGREEIEEINQQLRQEELKERYLWCLEGHRFYTERVLSKEYRADLHGHVVCYETEDEYIRFDCTKKTKHKTLPELLNDLRRKHRVKSIHFVFEATEAKKLCAWMSNLFYLGNQPYEPDFKEYLIRALKEHYRFPKGIKDLIVDSDT